MKHYALLILLVSFAGCAKQSTRTTGLSALQLAEVPITLSPTPAEAVRLLITKTSIRAGAIGVALDQGAIPQQAVKGYAVVPLLTELSNIVDHYKTEKARGSGTWPVPLVVAADLDTSQATLVKALYTAGQAQWGAMAIVMAALHATGYGTLIQVVVDP